MRSRLHVRWGNPPHVTSPTWGPPPSRKQGLRPCLYGVGRFLWFCVPQSVKTKQTNPARPGYPTPCKQGLRMDKTIINALVQSTERSLHLIYKNLFSIKQYQFPLKTGLNLFKESRHTLLLRVRRRLPLYIYPRRPEVMVRRDRNWRAYLKVCDQRGRNLTMTMAISPINCFPRQLLE